MQVGDASSRDVQLLLWAVGEARARTLASEADRAKHLEVDLPTGMAEFVTEWQPVTR